jgi:hypothetical protein
MFQERLGIDSLMFGLAMADEDAHAPNECFRPPPPPERGTPGKYCGL